MYRVPLLVVVLSEGRKTGFDSSNSTYLSFNIFFQVRWSQNLLHFSRDFRKNSGKNDELYIYPL